MALTTETDLDLLVETDAHEGPVYVAAEDALYFTTAPRPGPAGPRVDIRRLALDGARPTTVAATRTPRTGWRSRRTAAWSSASRAR